jgi:hypothetical protein
VKSLPSIPMAGGSTTCVRNHLETHHFKHEKEVKHFPDLVNFSWKSGVGSIRSGSKECNMTTISQMVHPMFLVTAGMPHTIESVKHHLFLLVCANNQLINLVLSDTSMNFLKFAFPSLHAVIPGRTKLAGIINDRYGKCNNVWTREFDHQSIKYHLLLMVGPVKTSKVSLQLLLAL